MPDALVTGAPGWIGTRLVEALASEGRTVRCLLHGRRDGPIAGAAEAVPGTLQDEASLVRLCRDSAGAVLFHCAGVIHPDRGVREFFEVHVDGTGRLLEAAARAGIRRAVVLSSSSAAGTNPRRGELFDEDSPCRPCGGYGRSKRRMELLVRDFHDRGLLETVVLRPPWFYGPGQPERQTRFFSMVRRGLFPEVGDGRNLRSMVYVDNLLQALLLAARVPEAAGRTYWIADPRPYPMAEVLQTVRRILELDFGLPVSRRRVRLPSAAGDVARWLDRLLQGFGRYHRELHVFSELDVSIACSVERARQELGFDPRVELEEGLRRSVEWCLERGIQV